MYLFGSEILNFIGGTVRYIFGSVWRTIANKPKFTFSQYINDPNNPDSYDEAGHIFNNKLIAVVVIGILFGIIL